MYSLSSWETTATDCYVNQGFRKVCVLLPTCSRMNILGAYASAWCGETDMKGIWLNWVLTSLWWQNSPPRSHRAQAPHLHPHCPGTVRNSTAAVPGPVSEQIWAPLKSAPRVCCSWATAGNSVNSGFTLLKTVRALGRGWEEAVQQVAKIFPNLCHVFNDQLWEVSGQFEWGHRRDLGRKPWDRSAACCATPKWFLTLVMMDVLIRLIFLLPFNVYCIKSFSLILYPIRATYSMLAMVLQWPNLIAEGRVLYNVVSFSQ